MGTDIQTKQLCVLTDFPLREGWERDFLLRTLMSAGIRPSDLYFDSVLTERISGGLIRKTPSGVLASASDSLTARLNESSPNTILTLGDYPSELLTGKSGIDKWQASVLFERGRKVIPCYPMERVAKDLSLQVWLGLCARKAAEEMKSPLMKGVTYEFLLNPPIEQTLSFLKERVLTADHVSVDIETGRGQVNTVGFAVSPTEAIAVNVLPDKLGASSHYAIWSVIRDICESETPKILQNFIYEQQYFSRYGIRLRNVTHDTMICQKFLWPEFEMGLDAVGRMYTDMPYWKEDGKSWNNIRDWERHYDYNCKDTAGTFAGFLGQRRDLEDRGLRELHDNYLRKLFPAITEMCSWGIPLSESRLIALRGKISSDYEVALAELRRCPGAEKLNPRSPAQTKAYFTGRGYQLYKKYDAGSKTWKESTDEKSLKKLRIKHPDDQAIPAFLKLSKLGKALSSYLNFTYDADKRMRFTLNCHGTETGRFSGYTDPWDHGVNPQTVPGGNKGINIKSLFEASPGFTFLQCDLRQAESRFVAYDSADLNLIRTLEDPARDIHKEVALEILATLGKPLSEYSKYWRQLGKKSGHGANYSMKEATFIDSCLQEMDVVLTKQEATGILEAYHKLFPGIRQWHRRLKQELGVTRKLTTPIGRERYFYGRLDDDMFRQAYAYRPQSTIPDITNHLMLHLLDLRASGKFNFRLLLQCHDSLLLETTPADVPAIAEVCTDTKQWHPRIVLSGGELVVPTETEIGQSWGEMKKYGN